MSMVKTAAGDGGARPAKKLPSDRVIMEDMSRKLTLWHTPTFRPILTHDDLEPILVSAGFSPLPPPELTPAPPAVKWREYEFRVRPPATVAGDSEGWRPRPRLPWPRVDGLHLMTYQAFFFSLEFYLKPNLVPDLFHVRSMPLSKTDDMEFKKTYRQIKDSEIEEEGILLYREGTLDHETEHICRLKSSNDGFNRSNSFYNYGSLTDTCLLKKTSHGEGGSYRSNDFSSPLVPLKDLFPSRDIVSFS